MEDHKIGIFEQQKLVLKDFFKKKKIGNKVEKEGNWLVWANLLEGGEYVVKELYGVNEWSGITHKVVFVDESQRECLSKG